MLNDAQLEAVARAICQREEFSERNWQKYLDHARMVAEALAKVDR